MNPIPRLHFDYAAGAKCGVVRNLADTITRNSDALTVELGEDGSTTGRGCKIAYRQMKERGCYGYSVTVKFLHLPK